MPTTYWTEDEVEQQCRATLKAERAAVLKIVESVREQTAEGSCSWGTADIIAVAIRDRSNSNT